MQIKVPCEVLARMAKLFEYPTDKDVTDCMLFRFEDGKVFATNRVVLICEKLTDFCGSFHMLYDKALIDQCLIETPFKSEVTITFINEIASTSVVTTLGYQGTQNLYVPVNKCEKLANWRNWIDDPVSASSGIMFWRKSVINAIMDCSPSGDVYFPEFINADRPMLVRDIEEENWFGLFIPSTVQHDLKSAKLPAWAR